MPGVLEEQEGCEHRLAMPLGPPGRAQGPAHQVGGDQQTRHPHGLQRGLEGADGDDDGGDAGFFQQSGDVSHGHVAHRSDRHQKGGLNILLLEQLDPARAGVLQQAGLGTRPNKGICRGGQVADKALLV